MVLRFISPPCSLVNESAHGRNLVQNTNGPSTEICPRRFAVDDQHGRSLGLLQAALSLLFLGCIEETAISPNQSDGESEIPQQWSHDPCRPQRQIVVFAHERD